MFVLLKLLPIVYKLECVLLFVDLECIGSYCKSKVKTKTPMTNIMLIRQLREAPDARPILFLFFYYRYTELLKV